MCSNTVVLKFVIFGVQFLSIVCGEDNILDVLNSSLENHLEEFVNNIQSINECSSNQCVVGEKTENSVGFSKKSDWFLNVPLLPIIVATSNSIPEGACKKELHLYLDHLKNGTLWATEMFDSSAKYPHGVFDGLTRFLGSYDQCMRIKSNLVNTETEKNQEIRSRYCLVDVSYKKKNEPPSSTGKLDIFFDPQISAWQAIRERGDFRRYRRYLLQMALCFPAKCQPEDIVKSLEQPLEKFAVENNLQIEIAIPPENCSLDPAKEVSKFSNFDKLFFVICILIIILVIVSTIIEKNSTQKKKLSLSRELLSCFDARKNFDEIFEIKHGHRGLDTTHFLRVAFQCMAVFGHRQILFALKGNTTGLYAEWTLSTAYFAVLQNGSIIINGFFGLGGFLLSYSTLQYLEKSNDLNVLRHILKRFLRLTPPYMFVTFAYATLFHRLGSGPFWEGIMSPIRDSCSTYWWANLFYVNNYFSGPNKCVIQSWYLAVDFQCYIIGLLLVGAFFKMSRKVGYAFLSCFLFFTMSVSFYATYVSNIAPIWQSITIVKRPEEAEYFIDYYVKTYVHLSSYIVGLILGACIYDYKHATWRISKFWSQFVCLPLTLVVIVASELIGIYFLNPNVETSALQKAIYASLHRPAFALGVCLLPILFTICDGLDFLINIVTAGWLQPISRLSYSVYLIHFTIYHYEIGIMRTPSSFSFYDALKGFVIDFVFSMSLGILFVIVLEFPFRNITNVCFKGKKDSKDTQRSSDTSKKVD